MPDAGCQVPGISCWLLPFRLPETALLRGNWFYRHLTPDNRHLLFKLPLPYVGEVAGDCGRRRHHRADKVGTSAAALSPFKVSIAR